MSESIQKTNIDHAKRMENEELCEALPVEVNWGDTLTPYVVKWVRDHYLAKAEQDAKRYRMLRSAPLLSDGRPFVTRFPHKKGLLQENAEALLGTDLDEECDKYINKEPT